MKKLKFSVIEPSSEIDFFVKNEVLSLTDMSKIQGGMHPCGHCNFDVTINICGVRIGCDVKCNMPPMVSCCMK
jgi:hypothetical protein